MQTDTAIVIQRMGQVETDRAHWRDPANAHTDPGFQARKEQGLDRIALVDKGRPAPFFSKLILVFEAAGQHVAPADAVALRVSR